MSSPSSSMTSQWKYDVFLSFSGVDTRNKFTGHLFAALERKGILTFIDNKLERGKPISSELLKTIEESRFAVIIFSRNYASSSWCLDELAAIVRCMKETGLTIFPIFYDVNPSDVRKQTGIFGQVFNKHEDEENIEEVKKWREALKEVANLAGWDLQDRHEAEFIEHLVEVISHRLNPKSSSFTKDLVGINSSVEKLFTSHLGFVNKVCMVGICGMGGAGKDYSC
ncbi:toll/interleukin-1 receptor-like protein [Quercus robur]|uniref:toll/interleukin-1 receptor-like protein n=1 Tax=Quercus robur TaxID=38942 RepID=UPI0021613EED|nr:toll/interleukin-1 receptor-like protein [Quercus robur]XP_050261540.1 toll/interleukin-1 receptor-like protein [Quercus robur]